MKTLHWQPIAIFLFFITGIGCSQSANSHNSASAGNKKECEGFATNSLGQQLSWAEEFPIKIYVDQNVPDQYIESIKNAMHTWNAELGFAAFQFKDVLPASDQPLANGKSVIHWLVLSSADRSEGRQAVTLVAWNGAGIDKADMLINARDFKYSTDPKEGEIDIESLVLHELGHILGLAHSSASGSAMNEHLPYGILRRSLAPEDIARIRCKYEEMF